MPNDHAELVSLLSVMSAAERGLSPLGPEFAGFVVLEAAQRMREAGGGVATARELAIDVGGHVHLIAQPGHGDEGRSTAALRALLGALLECATSSTPALRACARRKGQTSAALLARELQAALIPLNRSASRRGVARVAKSTAEALASGAIEAPSLQDEAIREPSPIPAPVASIAAPPPPVAAMTPLPSVIVADEATPCDAAGPWVEAVGATPVTLADVERTVPAPVETALVDGPEDEPAFEVVSNLPPIVVETVEAAPVPEPPRENRVEALLAGFSVSRLRDDPALSRDLKAMVGIDTAAPPRVAARDSRNVRDLRESASTMAVDVRQPMTIGERVLSSDDETPVPVDDDVLPRPRRRSARAFASFAFLVLGAAITIGAIPRARNAVRALFSPPTPPPGDATAAPTAPPIARPAASGAHLPVACEGTLAIDGVPAGAEVVRKLGVAPVSTSVPMHVPLDLVGTAPGMPARRVHVDPSAAWLPDVTGPHLEVPLMLDVGAATPWAPRTGELSPAPIGSAAGRGMLRIVGNPPGTTVWLVVAPSAIAVPCGSAVDLLVVTPPKEPRPLHIEWSAFTGAPPHAIAKL